MIISNQLEDIWAGVIGVVTENQEIHTPSICNNLVN